MKITNFKIRKIKIMKKTNLKAWKNNNLLMSSLQEETQIRRQHRKNSNLTMKTIDVVKTLVDNISNTFLKNEDYFVSDIDPIYDCLFLEDCYDIEERAHELNSLCIASTSLITKNKTGRLLFYIDPTTELLSVLEKNSNETTLQYLKDCGFPLSIRIKTPNNKSFIIEVDSLIFKEKKNLNNLINDIASLITGN